MKREEIWQTWRDTGDEEQLGILMDSFEKKFQVVTRRYSNPNMPDLVIKNEAKKQALRAFENYDPNKGVKLSTYVDSYMPKVRRTVIKNQNIVGIPEPVALEINNFQTVKHNLAERYRRDPSTKELADELGWSIKKVIQMENSLRPEMPFGAFEEAYGDLGVESHNRFKDIYDNIYYDLGPRESIVFEHTVGYNGKPILKGGDIAKKINTSPATVSVIKNNIGEKIKQTVVQSEKYQFGDIDDEF
jgi:DNA-directed RNA polymerase specialized sigma subunit